MMMWVKLFCVVAVAISMHHTAAARSYRNAQQEQDFSPEQASYADVETRGIIDDVDASDSYMGLLGDDSTTYNGYSYFYYPGRMNYVAAENYCANHGGHVAYVNMKTSAERSRVYIMFGKKINAWIGVQYFNMKWRYPDLTTVDHSSFGWRRGKPNYLSYYMCTENWWYDGVANNIACSSWRAVICEKKI